jgi:hypothetical protein
MLVYLFLLTKQFQRTTTATAATVCDHYLLCTSCKLLHAKVKNLYIADCTPTTDMMHVHAGSISVNQTM